MTAASLAITAGPATTGTTAPVVLYEDSVDEPGLAALAEARAERYLVIYQHLADPGSGSGTIDASKLLRYLGDRLTVDSSGWGVLDFEEPFDSRLLEGPTSDRWKATSDTMVEAMRIVKRTFPKMRWTYYGIPGLAYYLRKDGKAYTWDNAPDELKKAEMDRQLACYGPVLAECQWLAPCIYNTVGRGTGPAGPTNQLRLANRAYVRARTALCVDFARQAPGHPVVVPFASPLYQAGGGARCMSRIPYEVLLADCAQPVESAGADGLTIWTGAHCFVNAVTQPGIAPDFKDCGGRAIVAKTWAEDLGIPEAELSTPRGSARVRSMFSEAQRDLVRALQAAWSIRPKPEP